MDNLGSSSVAPPAVEGQSVVPPLVMDNSIHFKWLHTGFEAFSSMLAAINGAVKSVRLETYIYMDDDVGQMVRTALVEAAYRGVKVQVLVDALGSLNLPKTFWDPLIAAGGEFAFFNPLARGRWSVRDHRKLLVCDDVVAFIGGFNIANHYRGDGVVHGWRDLGLQVTGSLVMELAATFDSFFGRAADKPKRLQRFRRAQPGASAGTNWRLIVNGPGRRPGEFKRIVAKELKNANSVQIISAYFLPTWRLRKALVRVAKRGGRVQIILPGKSDVPISRLASRSLYRMLLRAGVEIYEYQPQILHSKLILMDDEVFVGSANLDTRSLWINYELVLNLKDPLLANQARAIFEQDLSNSRRIEPRNWRKARGFWEKCKESWAYFILARMDPYMARTLCKGFE
ncbi:MAG TPA: phospholipase D-like domain-containing protein [Verrucomicrobiae bacterium]|nr:phospholipase D-like domain-containing protein [Verrucomicrobiae bacterium]